MMEIIEEGARVLCEYTEAVADRLHLLAPKVVSWVAFFTATRSTRTRFAAAEEESSRCSRNNCRTRA
jgi:hypothetical protein